MATALGALLMFPLDRWAIVASSIERIGEVALGPLPDSLRLDTGGPPRLGIVGLALGAAASSWLEYHLLRGALRWRIGRFSATGPAARASLVAAGAIGVLAAGIRAVSDDLPSIVAAALILVPTGALYLAITASFGVPEATALIARVRPRPSDVPD